MQNVVSRPPCRAARLASPYRSRRSPAQVSVLGEVSIIRGWASGPGSSEAGKKPDTRLMPPDVW